MSDTDKLRIQVHQLEGRFSHLEGRFIQLEERVSELSAEVIRGRTEVVDAITKFAATVDERLAKHEANVDGRLDKLTDEVAEVSRVLLELPKLIVQAIADVAKKAP